MHSTEQYGDRERYGAREEYGARERYGEGAATRGAARTAPWALLGAAGLGAGAMYFLDPDRGARRRALVVDQLAHTRHATGDALGTTARDLRNRTVGAAAAVRSRLSSGEADDVVLQERVRAELGRVVSHPGAITVTAELGRVTLAGDVLSGEAPRLLSRVRGVRGVHEVADRLTVHESPGNVPALQGGPARRADARVVDPAAWTPTARLLAAAVAAGAAAFVLGRRGGAKRRRDGTAAAATGDGFPEPTAAADADIGVGTLRYEVGIITASPSP